MKITITNHEIETFVTMLANPQSFRNNISVKFSDEMDWTLRVNLKALNSRYEILNEAKQELAKEFIDAGKVDGDRVKEEYLQEYNDKVIRLMVQKNELDFTAIKRDEFKNLPLSMVERDFLMLMVEESEKSEEAENTK